MQYTHCPTFQYYLKQYEILCQYPLMYIPLLVALLDKWFVKSNLLLPSFSIVMTKWGIDHGTWTVLVHMFPDDDIPVVQLSVNRHLDPQQSYELGQKLASLREQGYLIFGSGNVVHNLGRVEWDNPDGTEMTHRFNDAITQSIVSHDHASVIHYDTHPDAAYAVPTPDHFLPLLYCLGAAGNDKVKAFNNVCNLGSMAMTGYVFG